MPGPLDDALDELYGADPGDFVTTRKRLVAALRTGGDPAAAKELAAARRPSTSAWALNQLARREPDLVASLLEQSAALVAAQTRALSGRPDAMREAIRTHRAALDAATAAAIAVLGARANDAFRSEIVSTLRAASSDDDIARQLRTGRLTREVSSPGFPDAAGLTLVPPPAVSRPSRAPRAAPHRAGTDRAVEREAAARAAEAEAQATAERDREAQRVANLALRDAARARVAEADADAARAHTRIDELQRELEISREELRDARDRSRRAAAEAKRLERP
jgi:hypothetical protein